MTMDRTSIRPSSPASVVRTRWPRPEKTSAAGSTQRVLRASRMLRVVGGLGAGIARRNHGDRLAAVGELQVGRHPDDVAQVGRRLEIDAGEAANGTQ